MPGFELTRRWLDGRDITPDVRTQVLEVLRIAFNNRASWFALPVTPEDHFDWKFRDRPTGVTVSLSVDANGRVIGFIGSVRQIWFLRGRPYVNRAGYDLSRLPEWQGRGVSRALQQFHGREWHPSEDFSLGYVAHPVDRHLSIEQGNKVPANETHDYVRLLRPFQIVRALLSRVRPAEPPTTSAPLSNTTRVIRQRSRKRADDLRVLLHRSVRFVASQFARRPAPRRVHWQISTITRFEQLHERFISEALSQFDFVADRSIPYLNWRFCDERAGPFTVRLAERDGEPVGYSVTRVFNDRASLADILVLPGQVEIAESLIRDAVNLAKVGGATSIRTRLPKRHPYGAALARSGFFDIGHVAGELLDPRGTDEADLVFLDREDTRIHHVLADSDF